RLAFLRAVADDDAARALAAALAIAPSGIAVDGLARGRNLTDTETEALLAALPLRLVGDAPARHAFSPLHWGAMRETLVAAVAAHHRRHPELLGIATDRVLAGTGVRISSTLVAAIADALVAEASLVKEGHTLRLPTHRARIEPADAARWKAVAPLLDAGGAAPPSVAEIADRLRERPDRIAQFLVRIGRHGLAIRVADNRFFRPAALQRLADLLSDLAAEAPDGHITVARFRDRSGVGRNLAIDVLEYFDQVKLTRRTGEFRVLARSPKDVFKRDEPPV
ncbi:MAG: hypothetical protein FJX67_10615, partial [Alphaproteobacteria bacterium]|nr:hypothetical protein [Alphaproteobacteria bacterium]